MAGRHSLRKLRGRSRAELVERSGQWLTQLAERWGMVGGRELEPKDLARGLDPASGVSSLDEWFARHRRGAVAPFFAGLEDRHATVTALRRLVPSAEPALLERADRMLSGRFDLLGLRDVRLPLPIDWQRDPITGVRAPLVHWSRIAYLDPKVSGDHKAVWEINRHHVLVSLGQAYWYTGDERWAEQALRWMDEWMNANPPKRGVNWASSLEIAFRAIAWMWTMQLLRDSPHMTRERFTRAVGFLVLSARHLERFLSTYFSPNTHLTGEALGLYVLGTQLSPLVEARRWRARGSSVLLGQLPLHVRDDGVYFEQATYYHRYTTDIYLQLLILAERCGDRIADQVQPPLQKLLDCLAAIQRPDGTIPLLGDDDGGRLLYLDGRRGEDVRGPLATAAALFGNQELAYAAQGPQPELVWLLGPAGADRWRALAPRAPSHGSRAFPSGGLYVMRDHWDHDASVMVIDCGPHGVFNGGHAHADALSFDLTVGGVPALVDPGTFTYTTDPKWRNHFRSSQSHNTVSINDESSSEMQDAFTWRSMASTMLERWHASDTIDFFDGRHDGYERRNHASVERQILYAKSGYWIVRDRITAPTSVRASGTFQCAAGLSLHAGSDSGFVVRSSAQDVLRMHVLGRDAVAAIDSGWVSQGYGAKLAAPQLRVDAGVSGHHDWTTVLSAPHLNVRVSRRDIGSGHVVEVLHGECADRSVFCEGGEHATIEGVDTDADVFFVRRLVTSGEACEVFASRATRLTVDGAVVATSPVPGVLAAARPTGGGDWRRRRVGATAPALGPATSVGRGVPRARASGR